jgi:hypothetical protein
LFSAIIRAAIELLTSAKIGIISFAPHTVHIVQMLDLALFGVLKRRGQYGLPFSDEKGTAQFITRVYHDFQLTMIEIGFTFVISDAVQCLMFNEMELMENGGFTELPAIDFCPEDLPEQHRRAQFVWVNKSRKTDMIRFFSHSGRQNSRYCGFTNFEKWRFRRMHCPFSFIHFIFIIFMSGHHESSVISSRSIPLLSRGLQTKSVRFLV